MRSIFLCRALILVPILAALAACQPSPSTSQGGGPGGLSAPRNGGARWHPDSVVVLPGETLYAISRRYDVPIRAIIDANRLEPPYSLKAGQSLILPQVRTHLVRAGDTLYGVSRQYGVDVATLAEANHLQAPFVIRTGTALVLPPAVGAPAPSVAASPGGSVAVTELPPPAMAAPAPAATPSPDSPRAPASAPPSAAPPAVQPIAPPTPVAPPPSAANPAPKPTPAPPPEQSASLPPARGEARFLWPVQGKVIAHYGPGVGGTHNDGINIAAPAGTPVLAAEAGTVAYAGNELRGYGNLVLIKHANGWMTAYAHNAMLLVKRGDKVRRGQVIARVGATGTVNEPQLHFEVRKGTRALDPTEYLSASAASG